MKNKLVCRAYQNGMKQMVKLLDWTQPTLIKGENANEQLVKELNHLGKKKVLFVTGKALTELHLTDALLKVFADSGIEYVVFDDVYQDPSIGDVETARAIYLKNGCDCIVAMGGGSAMDCAKGVGARIARPNKSIEQMRMPLSIRKKLPLLVAIPTTAGTGSETTIAAVIKNAETHEKFSVLDPVLRPKYALLDPELTKGLPGHMTSTTGLDALTHAVESYIGKSNTAETIECAEKAVKLIFENLYAAYVNGSDLAARANMLEASYYAGLAFTRAYVGYVHAIAHNFGAIYGTPHGLANAIALPYVLDYYGDTINPQLAKLAVFAGIDTAGKSESECATLFKDKIKQLNRDMNIPEKLDKLQREDIPLIAQRAVKEGNPLYPVPKILNEAQFEEIIEKMLP